MNITKTNKSQPELNNLSKSILVISTNYKIEKLYNILIKNPSLVNSKDQRNETFLSYALKRKNEKTAELILTSPILDISYQDDNGNSYLHLAVINQLENIVRLLIKKGADINMKNNEGNTPLHFAYSTGDIKFIAILIENNGDLTIKNNDGIMPEDIEIDSFKEILDSNYKTMNSNSNISNNDNEDEDENDNNNDCDNNETFENNEECNDNNNIDNKSKNKKNESIKMNWENNKINDNTINNSQRQLKYSLVNYFNSEENNENNECRSNNDYSNENQEEEESYNENEIKSKKLTYLNNGKDNLQNSDIFDLTSSLAYQEKVDNISYINSQIVGNPNNLSKNESNENGKEEKEDEDEGEGEGEDVVNIRKIKTNENKRIHKSLKENSNIEKIYQTQSFKTFFENGANFNYNNCVTDNGNKDDKQIYKKDYNTSINKEKKSIKNNENIKLNYISEFTQDFDFSPIGTLKEPLNKKKNNEEKNNNSNIKNKLNNTNYIYSNINKNLVLGNKPFFKKNQNNKGKCNSNNHDNNKSTKPEDFDVKDMNKKHINDHDDSLIKPHPNFLISKSIIDSSENTAENTRKSKINNKNDIKKPQDSLYIFLSEINMEKYYNVMNSNGFEDIQLLINETKSGIGVTDAQLKEGGIKIPGDRAKILIRLQEKAGNFVFQIPKNVYYICNDSENYENDFHIKKLKEWLKGLKIENYLVNFFIGGYHSIELMLLQMESKNPINDDILRDDLGIVKIGHRARIINKLLEEGKILNNKLKTSVLILGKKENEKICDCIIC